VTAADARLALVDAVRRDLYGQTGPDDAIWPGAQPKTVSAATRFDTWRDVTGALVDDDGNEVLNGSPLRRYGIGILFPAGLSRRQEEALDTAQAEAAHQAADTDNADGTGIDPPPIQPEGAAAAGHADADDAAEPDAPPYRPRSLAVSFLLNPGAETPIDVTVDGGRYEPLEFVVAGGAASFWRRRPVSSSVSFPANNPEAVTADLTDGTITMRVGAVYRPHPAGTIVTVYVVNQTPAGADLRAVSGACLFQARLTVRTAVGAVTDYPTQVVLDGEDRSLQLLYHRNPVQAVGHGCNARTATNENATVIVGEHFPVEVVRSPVPDAVDANDNLLAVDMDGLGAWEGSAQAEVDALLAAYDRWISRRRAEIATLPERLRDAAHRHLEVCVQFHADAIDGWGLARTDPDVNQVLRWTSEAMANQRRAYDADTRPLIIEGNRVVGAEGDSPHVAGATKPARWRAFQIAFLLASLPAVANNDDPRAQVVDIIWMPTGGGKTEAYQAVAAFTMLWRRLHQVRAGTAGRQGATVLMRYTLRLLTAQQLQRAAALICALERIRIAHPAELGDTRKFTIGAWLGRRSTPNDWSGARIALRDWRADATKRGFLLTRCPWCAAAIGRRPGAGAKDIDGYKTTPAPGSTESRVMAYCPDPACPFNDAKQAAAGAKPHGLPVYEADTDLYCQPPTFVVGTIDKFAQLSWRADPAQFFGLDGGRRFGPGPALLIQDELHLISGPLGSLDALYEPVVEDLCARDGGARPRIIAATATTRRYVEQIAALYGRDRTRLIPPPGLDAADNFFSRTNLAAPGKVFVGICAPGFGRAQEAQIRVLAALGHAGGSLDVAGHHPDPWWTNLCFFSSRRSLGLVQSLCQTHLRSHTWRLHNATGVDAGPRRASGTRLAQRAMTARVELTAQATADVSATMERLNVPYDKRGCADLCFATSMIEVGVDIDRLGLLTMFGQPKSASQYIQVAGRVGRDERDAPGVVFVVLSPYNNRDRSHFEQFSTFHRRLYASVEPVSITPFTPAALDRGLAGSVTAWLRQAVNPPTPAAAVNHLSAALAPSKPGCGPAARRNATSPAGPPNSTNSSRPPPTPNGGRCDPAVAAPGSYAPSATTPPRPPTTRTPSPPPGWCRCRCAPSMPKLAPAPSATRSRAAPSTQPPPPLTGPPLTGPAGRSPTRTRSDGRPVVARQVFYTPIKRSHMVAPFGVGALLLARNGVGVVVCGLDEWLQERPNDGRGGASWLERNQIIDAHLQHRLGVNRLIQPPTVGSDPSGRDTWFVRVARFPLTEYCINPKCRRLVTRLPEGVSQGGCIECEQPDVRRRAWPTQQVPLVLACPAGHLSDIPWDRWAHDPDLQTRDDNGQARHPGGMCTKLTLTYRVATDITAPVLECTHCGASIDLGALRNQGHDCPGGQPWLPGTSPAPCTQRARVLERTATGLYYPEVRSALHLPHGPAVDHRLMALLAEPVAQVILGGYTPGDTPDDRDLNRLAAIAAARGITATAADIARHVAIADAEAPDIDDQAVRAQELAALLDPTDKSSSAVGLPPLIVEARSVDDYHSRLFVGDTSRFTAVSAIPRLAETRALVAFSRVTPGRPTPREGFAQQWGGPLDATRERDWLVAHRVYGEGILLVLDPDAVRRWEVITRVSDAWYRDGAELAGDFLTPRHLLAHTLAHVILREAAAVCGYALPSLRERVYATADDDGVPQTAVLIYTAEGDSYGTLGGLVELADPGNLEALIERALDSARWCGADPVCMNPPEGAGLQISRGSCHHCLLLPETSCELFNNWLDRAALVAGRANTPAYFD